MTCTGFFPIETQLKTIKQYVFNVAACLAVEKELGSELFEEYCRYLQEKNIEVIEFFDKHLMSMNASTIVTGGGNYVRKDYCIRHKRHRQEARVLEKLLNGELSYD